MKLSVALVNHNQKDLLRQALNALTVAVKNIDYEFIIVDNGSADGSAEMLHDEFPRAQLIINNTNRSVCHANNQALKMCAGEYILIVTPDTKCGMDSLEKMIAFMDGHNDAAGMSVRLLSPQGRFIPESIHGLTPFWATFFKLTGFAKHLVKTRLYDKTRKDWVEEFQITEIDIVHKDSMFLRRSALLDAGIFDERFAEYGYDIDLSYRLRLAGYRNYYFPKTYFFKYNDDAAGKLSWQKIRHLSGAIVIFALKYLLHIPLVKLPDMQQLPETSYEFKG